VFLFPARAVLARINQTSRRTLACHVANAANRRPGAPVAQLERVRRGGPSKQYQAVQTAAMYYVYVLRSLKGGRLYKGITDNVPRRLAEHNEGVSSSTKAWRPWELIHLEEYPARADAIRRERYLKTGRGRDELHRILKEKLGAVARP